MPKPKEHHPESHPPSAAPAPADTPGPPPAPGAEPVPETPADADSQALQTAIAEAEDLRQRLTRWQADFENLRRRSAHEILAARQMAEGDFAKDLLNVLDHFQSALSLDPAKTNVKTLLEGIKITYDELIRVLARRGIESYDPTGEPFDPHQQEAIAREVSAEQPSMRVLQTLQLGYRLGQRILRPAKVKVSIAPSAEASGR